MLEKILEKKRSAELVVLAELRGNEKSATELRQTVNDELAKQRLGKMSIPAFNKFMAEIEERSAVVGESRPQEIRGVRFQVRWYSYSCDSTVAKEPESAAVEEIGFERLLGPWAA